MTPRHESGLLRLASLSTRAEESKVPVATVLAMIAAIAMAVTHMVQVYAFILPSGQFKNLHVGFALLIAFLAAWERTPADKRSMRVVYAVLAVLALVPLLYIHWAYPDLIGARRFVPNPTDMAVAVLLLVLALLATVRDWGWTIPALAVVALFYGYFGYLMPGELLFHGGISPRRLIGYTSIPYFQGLLGGLTELSAGTIFLFMVFAGVLKVTGGIDFIIKVGYAIGGRGRAGPAQVAVVSSGFMGMLSGSTVANVASTGALTIPMMKRFGFRPEFAGAVESVASTGGQFMPPVMGLAAFLIVGMTGIPYFEVMAAAVFPAFIFYLYLMVGVHLRAARVGLDARKQEETDVRARDALREAMSKYWHLLLGIAVLIYFLVIRMPPGIAALFSALALLALDSINRLVRGRSDLRRALKGIGRMILQGLEEGGRTGAQVATVIAVISILIEVLAVTGFAQKLSNTMLELSGGNLSLLMIIAAGTCLAFGLGLPTSAAYILVALLGAPALADLGVPLLAAHFFVFYFANMSGITPPVAVTALVGANIAQARFLPTAMLSVRLGLPGFLLPFLFVARPEILGIDAGLLEQALVALLALIAVMALNIIIEGYFLAPMVLWERLLLLPAAFGLLHHRWETTAVGLVLLAVVAIHQATMVRRRKQNRVDIAPGRG